MLLQEEEETHDDIHIQRRPVKIEAEIAGMQLQVKKYQGLTYQAKKYQGH